MAEQRRRSAAGLPRTRVARHETEKGQGHVAPRAGEARSDLTPIESQSEGALRGARVYVFSQDKALQRTRVYSPRGPQARPPPDREEIVAAKRRVLATGQAE